MENEFNSKIYNAFKIPAELLNQQSPNSATILIQTELFRNACIKVLETFRIFAAKFIDNFNNFFSKNPQLLDAAKRFSKYQKRVKNRNKLYIKRKNLGRKL